MRTCGGPPARPRSIRSHAPRPHQAVIPRTTKQKRLDANLDVFSFDLSDAEMQQLDALDGTKPE